MSYAITKCLNGEVRALQNYLQTSTEKHLFLRGTKETEDKTLILAAAERYPEIVSLLLEHGADVDAINNGGRTPLMESALWGRLRTVKVLLKANANPSLRDRQGCSAVDLAQPAPKNQQERYFRSEAAAELDRDACDRQRRQIAILLGPDVEIERKYSGPVTETALKDYWYKKSRENKTITLHGPLQTQQVRNIWKTAAVLDRGDPFDKVSATSGWGRDALPKDLADGPSWVDRVFFAALEVGHELKAHHYDKEWEGEYNASHAEKKLIAYFINKHVFSAQDRLYSGEVQAALEKVRDILEEAKHESKPWARVCDLDNQNEELKSNLVDACDEGYEDDAEKLRETICHIEEELRTLAMD